MNTNKVVNAFLQLKHYCEQEHFKGWDPYDGLNSKVAQAILPLKYSALLRLCVIQGFKRCPVNLRPIALVPKDYNAKGIGLFLQGYCNLYKLQTALSKGGDKGNAFGTKEEIKNLIDDLAELLISLRSNIMTQNVYHGACWGYNFDWQARCLFLFPAYTPTVVATCFCATALMDAYEVTHNQKYLDVALSSAAFVIKDLHRTPYKDGFLFSYSPLKGNDTVFNASLLGAKLLSLCYHYTRNEEYRDLAHTTVKTCCESQRADGAWIYGMLPVQNWVDSFHTGYNLDALIAYEENTGDSDFHECIKKGFDYYISHFFEADGTPKYYDNHTYPIDIHCPAQLFVTLHRLHKANDYIDLEELVMPWTISHMQDKNGYFYYQLREYFSSKIPYMRWSNAFMFNAFTCYFLDKYQS